MSDATRSDAEFASAYEAAAHRLFVRIERSCSLDVSWPQRVCAAIVACLDLFAADPATGCLLVFEADVQGRDAQRRHERTIADIVELFREGRDETSSPPLPESIEEGIVGGLSYLIGRALRRGEADGLPELAPELITLALTPYLGRLKAARVASGAVQ